MRREASSNLAAEAEDLIIGLEDMQAMVAGSSAHQIQHGFEAAQMDIGIGEGRRGNPRL